MTMRQSVFIFLIVLLLGAFGDNNQSSTSEWEYNVVYFEGSKLPSVYSPNDKKAPIKLSDSRALLILFLKG